MRDVIASYWYVPWLQGGCQDRLAGSSSMDGFVAQLALNRVIRTCLCYFWSVCVIKKGQNSWVE